MEPVPDTLPMMRLFKVLLVEDRIADAEINALTLRSNGLKVLPRRVETELDYLLALREEPDLVLASHAVAGFDAQRALKLLRDQDSDTPFIVVSNSIGEAATVELMKAGANDFVRKDELSRLALVVRRELLETERRRALRQTTEKLQRHEETHDSLLGNLPGMVYRLRADAGTWRFDFASDGCQALMGHDRMQVAGGEGLEFSRILYGDVKEPQYEALRRALESQGDFTLEHRILCAGGEVKWVWHRGTVIQDREGKPQYVEGFLADVTAQKLDQAKIDYLAHHDVLTGLANRTVFEEHLTHSLERVKRHFQNVTLLFVDLDDFKTINDTLGHQAGDAVLRNVAGRLTACCRKGDIVARLGGDEFALVMDDGERSEDVAQFAPRLLEELAQPMKVGGKDVQVTASVGIAIYPADGEDVTTLLKNADAAMYAAKRSGRNTFRFFAKKMNERARSKVVMREALQRALRRRQFEPHYLPEVQLAERRITGVEQLARWRRAPDKLMTAEHFIPFAVDAGIIVAIDHWMLRAACKRATEWGAAGIPYGRIAVNLSAQTLADPKLAQTLETAMREFAVAPEWLEVELTEDVILQDTVATRVTLDRIADLGVMLTLDDFGRGYASLNHLKRFPIHRVKIDREFVKGLPWREDDVQFCRAVLALAESLHIEVVAEGVERQEQELFLRHAGCHAAQGHWFSAALSTEQCARLLSEDISLADPEQDDSQKLRDDLRQLLGRRN